MKFFKNTALVIGAGAMFSTATLAADGFHPNDNCYATIETAEGPTSLMLATWATGFIAALGPDLADVNLVDLEVTLQNIAAICDDDLDLSIQQAVQKMVLPEPGSAADARAFLMQFYAVDVNNTALTQSLIPSEAEIRAIYQEPIASKLVDYIMSAFTSDVTFNPKPTHDDLLVVWTQTDNLIAGDTVLREFPGGYGQVTEFLNPGFPVVRFKFIASGETSGLAFDGMFFINDHWVIIPKPWRVLR